MTYNLGGVYNNPSSPYQFSAGPTTPAYDLAIAALSPLAWWKLDDPVNSTTAADSSGNGYNGTVTGSLTFGEPGPLPGETAVLFPLTGGEITNAAIGTAIGTTCTVILWLEPSGSGSAYQGLVTNDVSGFTNGFDIGYSGPGTAIQISGRGPATTSTAPIPTTSQWNMIAVTWDGAHQTGYTNAVAGTPIARTATLAGSTLQVGNRLTAAPFVTGYIAQVAVFSYALNGTQISALYAAASSTSGPLATTPFVATGLAAKISTSTLGMPAGTAQISVEGDVLGGAFPVIIPSTSTTPPTPSGTSFSAASATTSTITATGSPAWTVNEWYLWPCTILSGTGAGQMLYIVSNTANVLTLHGSFAVTPDTTSVFQIGFDVNYNAVQTVFTQIVHNVGAGRVQLPAGTFYFPNGFPPIPSLVVEGNQTTLASGSSITAAWFIQPSQISSFKPIIRGCIIIGPDGSLSQGAAPPVSRTRGVRRYNGMLVQNCTIQGFWIGESTSSDHAYTDNCLIQGNFYNIVVESFGNSSWDQGSIGWNNVNSNGAAFASFIVEGSTVVAGAEYIGAQGELGNAIYGFVACDFIDEVTGYPGNIQFSTVSATSNSITTEGVSMPTNYAVGQVVYIVSGTGAGQVAKITANTATTYTISGTWSTTPDATSVFNVAYQADIFSATSIGFSGAGWPPAGQWPLNNWPTNGRWNNFLVRIIAGTGAGQGVNVVSNTATTVTTGNWSGSGGSHVTPDATSVFTFERGGQAFDNFTIDDGMPMEGVTNGGVIDLSISKGTATVSGCVWSFYISWLGEEVAGWPCQYAIDLNQSIGASLTAEITAINTPIATQAVFRFKYANWGTFVFGGALNAGATYPMFAPNAGSSGIQLKNFFGGAAGISVNLAGTVQSGEPLEWSTVLAGTAQKYIGSQGLVIPAGVATLASGSLTYTGQFGFPLAYVSGWTLAITAGTGAGQSVTLNPSSTGDTLSFTAFGTAPDSTSVFLLTEAHSGPFYGIAITPGTSQTGGVVIALQEGVIDFDANTFTGLAAIGDDLIPYSGFPGYLAAPPSSNAGSHAGTAPSSTPIVGIARTASSGTVTLGQTVVELWRRDKPQSGFIRPGTVTSLPTASAAYRDQFLVVPGNGTTTADTVYICLQSSSGTYSWKSVVSG